MRAFWTAAAALAAFSVASCDINTGDSKAGKVACNCATPGAQPPAPVVPEMRGEADYSVPPPARHHRHYAWHDGGWRGRDGGAAHSYYWRREYAEISVQTYDYRSTSHAYYMGGEAHGGGGASAYAYAGASAYGGGSATAGAGAYGGYDGHDGHYRGHGDGHGAQGGATVGDAVSFTPPPDDRARMSPWHAYDIDCPDDGPRGPHR